jgi:hypothetical protein
LSAARIVLVVLDWKSQPWWPLLVSNGGRDWSAAVGRFCRLAGGARTLRPGRTPDAAFFGRGFPDSDLFVLEFDFSGNLKFISLCFAAYILHGDWSIEASGFSTEDPEIAALSDEFRACAAIRKLISTRRPQWVKPLMSTVADWILVIRRRNVPGGPEFWYFNRRICNVTTVDKTIDGN